MPIAINGSGTVTGISVGGLPDGIVDTDMLANNAVTAAKSTGLGISVADQWRLTSDFSVNDTDSLITSNLERVDTSGQGTIGTAMSESSGVFTFPSTGIYKVDFQFNAYATGDRRYIGGRIQVTTNNSSYARITDSSDGISVPATSSWGTGMTSSLIDVTDTSNVKVKFECYSHNESFFKGDSTQNKTFMTFVRLGDT